MLGHISLGFESLGVGSFVYAWQVFVTTGTALGGTGIIVEKKITGNYEMNLVLNASDTSKEVKVFFAVDQVLSKRAYLAISADGFKIVRQTGHNTATWKKYSDKYPTGNGTKDKGKYYFTS